MASLSRRLQTHLHRHRRRWAVAAGALELQPHDGALDARHADVTAVAHQVWSQLVQNHLNVVERQRVLVVGAADDLLLERRSGRRRGAPSFVASAARRFLSVYAAAIAYSQAAQGMGCSAHHRRGKSSTLGFKVMPFQREVLWRGCSRWALAGVTTQVIAPASTPRRRRPLAFGAGGRPKSSLDRRVLTATDACEAGSRKRRGASTLAGLAGRETTC